MRLTKLSAVSLPLLIALAVPALSLPTQEPDTSSEAQKGAVPRSSAARYKAHATNGHVSVGAELLTSKEVAKEFLADVNRCCLVVLVAVYPYEKEPLQLSRDDFTLAIEGTDIVETPQDARTLSSRLCNATNIGVTTASVGVGVEVGTYGRAVTISASVGVGTRSNGPPSAAEREREMIERELSGKSLPEARISVPVSGYLYFPLPKQKKPAKYRLEYELKGQRLVLPLS
jgi:hypothetical protein